MGLFCYMYEYDWHLTDQKFTVIDTEEADAIAIRISL